MSLGSLHVLRAYIVHTCGEPNQVESTAAHDSSNGFGRAKRNRIDRHALITVSLYLRYLRESGIELFATHELLNCSF